MPHPPNYPRTAELPPPVPNCPPPTELQPVSRHHLTSSMVSPVSTAALSAGDMSATEQLLNIFQATKRKQSDAAAATTELPDTTKRIKKKKTPVYQWKQRL